MFQKMTHNLRKRMEWYDYSLFKITMMVATLAILTIFPSLAKILLSISWYWYVILTLLGAIPLWIKAFK